MGVYLEKLTFNNRLDNSREHVVHHKYYLLSTHTV